MGNIQLKNMSLLLMLLVLLLRVTIDISDFILIGAVVISIILRLISMPIIKGYISRLKGDD